MSIRVIHVVWSATVGGIEKLVIDLAGIQKNNSSLHVEVLIARPEGGFMQVFREIGIPVHTLDMKSGGDVSPACYRRARSLFQSCDIIHMHSFNPLIAAAARNSGKKIIYTEHGNFGFGRKFSIRRQMLIAMQKKFLNDYVRIITFNSAFTKETAEKRYGLKKTEKRIIYNGILLPFTGQPVSDELVKHIKGSFIVGTVARLAAVKRIDRLLRAFASFKGNRESYLLIIGDGPLTNELRFEATELGIAGRTIFAGYRNDARSWLQLMNVVVLPTAVEAFGIAAVEGWDAGKPVIAFAGSGGLAELVIKEDAANVVEDEHQLSQRIEYYFKNGDQPESIEKRKQLAAHFDIRKMEQEFFNLYTTI